jgi:hypothetical protein
VDQRRLVAIGLPADRLAATVYGRTLMLTLLPVTTTTTTPISLTLPALPTTGQVSGQTTRGER